MEVTTKLELSGISYRIGNAVSNTTLTLTSVFSDRLPMQCSLNQVESRKENILEFFELEYWASLSP